jgi:hypothetical protein
MSRKSLLQINIPSALYSAYNHKRATAAPCRESHQRRTDATTVVPFPASGGVTHGILQWWRDYHCTHCIFCVGISTASVAQWPGFLARYRGPGSIPAATRLSEK